MTTASASASASAASVPASVRIGTHDGSFHCDEALACFMLHQTEQFRDAPVVRTRDPAVHEQLTILVDVGAVYDPAKHRYDHHQRGFTETFSPAHKIKLSSAGLVYKHFGREIVQSMTGLQGADLEAVYQCVYTDLIEGLDGIDNGVNRYPPEIVPAYANHTDLPSRVGRLNPRWNETGVDLDARFAKAMEIAGEEFVHAVMMAAQSWLPARQVVMKAFNERFEVHPSGQILLLKEYTYWKEHVMDLEKELGVEKPILYVLYTDSSKKWRIQTVPLNSHSFVSRKPLPEPWWGLRDSALSELTGVPGCVFTHANGFIGGTETYESVVALAVQALDYEAPANGAKKPKLGDA